MFKLLSRKYVWHFSRCDMSTQVLADGLPPSDHRALDRPRHRGVRGRGLRAGRTAWWCLGNGEGGGGVWNMGDVWGSWAARNLKKWITHSWEYERMLPGFLDDLRTNTCRFMMILAPTFGCLPRKSGIWPDKVSNRRRWNLTRWRFSNKDGTNNWQERQEKNNNMGTLQTPARNLHITSH